MRYIYCSNLLFLNNVITIKTKVLLPYAEETLAEFGYPVLGTLNSYSHVFYGLLR